MCIEKSHKRVYITIDTEMDSDLRWKRHWPASFTSVIQGIPNILRPIWNKYKVHPIYFVSPEVLYDETCCKVLKNEIENGSIIGAHLHFEYVDPNMVWDERVSKIVPGFPGYELSTMEEYEKITNLKSLIEKKLGITPEWYRAARFGLGENTIANLKKSGFKYDSSITPGISWGQVLNYKNYDNRIFQYPNGIIEFPITITGKRFGFLGKLLPDNWIFYKWLRPTNMTWFEQKSLIREISNENRSMVMMFHSTEIMPQKSPYVWGPLSQRYFIWKLKKVLEYTSDQGYTL